MGVVAGVVADDHGEAVADVVVEDLHESRRRADDHGAVHAVGAAAEVSAQPGGAELEQTREAVRQLRGRRAVTALRSTQQCAQFLGSHPVGIVVDPRAHGFHVV